MTQAMSEPTVVDSSEELDGDKINVSRWANYGKDRLYINHNGSKSRDDCFVDLDGDEGHSTWAGANFEVDGDRVRVEFETGWDGNWTEHHFEVQL